MTTKKTQQKIDLSRVLLLWVPVIAWMGVIFLFSSLQTPTVTKVLWTEFVVKKTAHVIEYFTLACLYYRALLGSGVNTKKAAYLAFLLSAFYAVSDEFHQSFTPGREPKIRDVLIDVSAGGVAAIFLLKYLPVSNLKIQKLAKKLSFLL